MITIRIEPPPDLEAKIQRLAMTPGALERAAKRAVGRTLRGGKKDAGTKVKQRYTINAGEVIRTIKLSQNGLRGSMWSSDSKKITLKKFRIRPRNRPRKMPAGGVYAQVVRGQGGNLLHAFVRDDSPKDGGGGVWERVGRPRFPVRHLRGPSPTGMLGNKNVGPHIEKKMFQRLQINLDQAINAVIGGFA